MKAIGITGPPGAGKTTVWRAVTLGHGRGDIGTVEVPDSRLDELVRMEGSRRRVPVQIELVDVHAAARTEAAAVARLREMDAILLVLPAFGGQDPVPALGSVSQELALADMAPIEKRLERAKKDPSVRMEAPALEAALALLEQGRPLREGSWEPADLQVFSPISPVTLKPVLTVWNVDEDALSSEPPQTDLPSIAVAASLEAEVAGLQPEEAAQLLEAYGVKEPAAGRLVDSIYRLLDLITFLTASDKESRAWEVRRGATAPEAAGVVHSDMQRGFIRAEVVAFDDLARAGSWHAAKVSGLVRVEGKEYGVREGDVIYFRFAV